MLVDDEQVWTFANPIGFLRNDLFDAVARPHLGGRAAGHDDRERGRRRAALPPRSTDVSASQLKWPLLAVVLFGAVYGGRAAVPPHWSATGRSCSGVSLAGIPISVAIAVLRYRLYAIDHIISRTVSWAVITALLVAVFVGGVLGLQAALAGVTQAPTLAVAASTLRRARCSSRSAAACSAPSTAASIARASMPTARRRASRIGSAARSRSTRSRIDLQTTIDRSVRPSTQGLWLRVARDRPAASGS